MITSWGDRPYVTVDLGALYDLSHIVLAGSRGDWRSANVRVGVGVNSLSFKTDVGTWTDDVIDLTSGDPIHVNLSLTARWIILMRDEVSRLRLCRVEVYGVRLGDIPALPALPPADPPVIMNDYGLGRAPFESGDYRLVRASLMETGVSANFRHEQRAGSCALFETNGSSMNTIFSPLCLPGCQTCFLESKNRSLSHFQHSSQTPKGLNVETDFVQQYFDGARLPLLLPSPPSNDDPRWWSPAGGYVDSIVLDMKDVYNISAVSLINAPGGERARAGVRDYKVELATVQGKRINLAGGRPVFTQIPHLNASRLTDGIHDEAAGPCPIFHNTSDEHSAWVAIDLGDVPFALDFIKLHFVPGVGGRDYSLRIGNTSRVEDSQPCAAHRSWDWHLPSTRDHERPYYRPWATYGCAGTARYVFVEQGHDYAYPVQLCEVEVLS